MRAGLTDTVPGGEDSTVFPEMTCVPRVMGTAVAAPATVAEPPATNAAVTAHKAAEASRLIAIFISAHSFLLIWLFLITHPHGYSKRSAARGCGTGSLTGSMTGTFGFRPDCRE
jgi:hypothetical protein